MDEDNVSFFADSTSYLESLMRSRQYVDGKLLAKLDQVIESELELAQMGADKAKSEILKGNKNNVVRPIK